MTSDAPIPELSRRVLTDRADGLAMIVDAKPAERDAVARRLGLPVLSSLSCNFELRAVGGGVFVAQGSLRARVTRICVLTAESFEADVRDDFHLRFVPAGQESADLDPEGEDEIPYQHNTLDLGEATVEQLALALEAYPRRPGAVLPDSATDEESSPFAMLKKLKTPLQ